MAARGKASVTLQPQVLITRSPTGVATWRATRGIVSGDDATVSVERLESGVSTDVPASALEFSRDGRLLAVVEAERVLVYSTPPGGGEHTLQRTLDVERVFAAHFSPLGTYLLTWSRPLATNRLHAVGGDAVAAAEAAGRAALEAEDDGSEEAGAAAAAAAVAGHVRADALATEAVRAARMNLKVWRVADGEEMLAFEQKAFSRDAWPTVAWTADEAVCAHMVSTELQFYSCDNFSGGVVSRIKCDGQRLGAFRLAPAMNSDRCFVAVFTPERKGAPGGVRVFRYPDVDRPVAQKNFFKAEDVKLVWSYPFVPSPTPGQKTAGGNGPAARAAKAAAAEAARAASVAAAARKAAGGGRGGGRGGRRGGGGGGGGGAGRVDPKAAEAAAKKAAVKAEAAAAAAEAEAAAEAAAAAATTPRECALLVETHTDIDKTGKSYYGETALYFLSTERRGEFDCNVPLEKEGPIHGASWDAAGSHFAVSYGFMPTPQTSIFNNRCERVADCGLAGRNTVVFNPMRENALLAVAGFGSLPGDVDVWDINRLEKCGVFCAPTASEFDWAPDGRLALSSVLSPRMHVGNGFTIWGYDGQKFHQEDITELQQAIWQPTFSGQVDSDGRPVPVFADCPPSPRAFARAKKQETAPAHKPAAYVPPHLRKGGAAAGGIVGSSGPGPAAANKPKAAPADGPKRYRPNTTGSGGRGASGAAVAAKKQQPATTEEAARAAAAAVVMDAAARGRRLRELRKTLQQIRGLRQRRERGETLTEAQEARLDKETELQDELAALEKQEEEDDDW